MSKDGEAYTYDELLGLPVEALPSRGPVCPKCGNHIPQFADLSDKDETRLCNARWLGMVSIRTRLRAAAHGALTAWFYLFFTA